MTDQINVRNPAALGAALRGDWQNALVASTPGGIEAQEAAGQCALVASEMLPKEGTIAERFYHREGEEPNRAKLEAMGFVFGDEIDDLFVSCTLPPGWKKEASDHSMWSYLKDEQGRSRANIFYKAAFYDRSAHFNLRQRYSYGTFFAPSTAEPEDTNVGRDALVCEVVRDEGTGKVLFSTDSYHNYDFDAERPRRAECRAWMEEHYPNWQDPFAYWGEAPT